MLKTVTLAGLILFASGTALAGAESNPLKPLLGERDTTIVLGDAPDSGSGSIFTLDVLKDDPSVLGKGDDRTFDSDLPQYLLDHRRRFEDEDPCLHLGIPYDMCLATIGKEWLERQRAKEGPRCSNNVRPGTVIYTNPPIYNCDDLAEQDEQLRNTIREMVIEILEELRDNGNYREQLDILNGILKQGGKVTN